MERAPLAAILLLPLLCAGLAQAGEPPATIAGRDEAWWRSEARARERAVERGEQALAAREERETAPVYRNVPGQIYRGRDDYRYRETLRCDELRDEVEAARRDLDDFEDLARRLGVPPGWLR